MIDCSVYFSKVPIKAKYLDVGKQISVFFVPKPTPCGFVLSNDIKVTGWSEVINSPISSVDTTKHQ